MDGNIHASEVSPSSACLYFLDRLTKEYGTHPDITRCLDTRAFYICPRINADGAEWALADKPKIIRSSTRPYPFDEEPLGGLSQEDIDGDGRMLLMRLPDPNGGWKKSDKEPRLLVRREPGEYGGEYYRVLPEGLVEDYDGVTVRFKPKKERLDLNRNFPMDWRMEHEQQGAGPYPTSEPEVRAVVHFISMHPNITGVIAFHTYSGVLLRPYSTKPDDTMAAEDLWTYQKIGKMGTDLTGYPNISVYHDFRYHPKEVITGALDDWSFDHIGVFSWTVEIWSPQHQAGIGEYKPIEWFREHSFDDDLKLLKWSDETLGGKGYVDWYPFEHPQLGPLEIGGITITFIPVLFLFFSLAAPASARQGMAIDPPDCLGCHSKTIQPEAFAASVHGKNACTSCHVDITDLPKHMRGEIKVQKVACERCHKRENAEHYNSIHVQKDVRCANCHTDIHTHTPWKKDKRKVVAKCIQCHDGTRASNECATCHSKDVGDAPRNPTQGYVKADIRTDGCRGCHSMAPCIQCHGVELPHSQTFIAGYHARKALLDPKMCAKCHTVDVCRKCHQSMRSSASGVPINPHAKTPAEFITWHRDAKGNGLGSCSCHDQDRQRFCNYCHGPQPSR